MITEFKNRKSTVSFMIEFEAIEKLVNESKDLGVTLSNRIRQILLDHYGIVPPVKPVNRKRPDYIVISRVDPDAYNWDDDLS